MLACQREHLGASKICLQLKGRGHGHSDKWLLEPWEPPHRRVRSFDGLAKWRQGDSLPHLLTKSGTTTACSHLSTWAASVNQKHAALTECYMPDAALSTIPTYCCPPTVSPTGEFWMMQSVTCWGLEWNLFHQSQPHHFIKSDLILRELCQRQSRGAQVCAEVHPRLPGLLLRSLIGVCPLQHQHLCSLLGVCQLLHLLLQALLLFT